MPMSALAAFWGVALLLIIVPGADWAFTISAGMRGNSVVPAVGGLVVGYSLMTAVVAGGVGVLVSRTPLALTALTVVGGAYLMWYGARTIIKPASPVTAETVAAHDTAARDTETPTGWATLLEGVGVSGLNPKGLLIFVALLPQFTTPTASWPLALQMAVLGLVFVVTGAVFYLGLSSVTRSVLFSRPSAARAVSRISGCGMIVIGGLLILERVV